MFNLEMLHLVSRALVANWMEDHGNERGEVTEKVLVTSIFAALAIAASAIIVTKVTSKANSIPTS